MSGIFDELRDANNGIELSGEVKDDFLNKINTTQNQEGYYLDAFSQPISFNGIRQLKRPYTKMKLNKYQQQEIIACQDYYYFRRNYCKILTKSGIGRPEPREYQERLENELVEGDDVIAFFPRQCISADTSILINNKEITALDFFKLCELEDKYYTKPKKVGKKILDYMTYITNVDILPYQLELIRELVEAINNGFSGIKKEWVYKWIKGGLKDSYIHQTIKICEYNKREEIKSSDNTFEKMSLLYSEQYAKENYFERNNKFKQGVENPAYNHQGKFSSLSDNFIHKDRANKEEIKQKISKSNKKNGNNDTTRIFYTSKGFSEDETDILIAERQTTFSLEICIEKYGEIEGTLIFKERQEKWQVTLNSKPENEQKRIRIAKGTGLMNKLFDSNPETKKIAGILYYIRFYNEETEFWKIGITSKSIKERFGKVSKYNLNMEILIEEKDTFYNCYKKEQKILRDNSDNRIIIDYNLFKTTEAFKKDIINEII